MDTIVWTVIGTIATTLTSFGFVPQVRKMWKRRSVGDVSIGTFSQFTAGATLWTIYGFSRSDAVVIGANISGRNYKPRLRESLAASLLSPEYWKCFHSCCLPDKYGKISQESSGRYKKPVT